MPTMLAKESPRETAPAISVIMPVYNGERFLAEAIDSILAQTFSDFEFIIVDDGSTDGTARIIRDYAGRDRRIRPLHHETNRGQSSALNTGIAAARGEFIAGMDADDISLPERLQKQIDYLRGHSHIGALGVFAREIDADGQFIREVAFPQSHAWIIINMLFGSTSVGGSLAMLRRDELQTIGGYNASALANDWELWTRLAERTRFANLPETLYLYRKHEASITVSQRQQLADAKRAALQRWLERLWGEAPCPAFPRIYKLGRGAALNMLERRRLRGDLARLSHALLAANCVDEQDRALLEAEFARRLAGASPRLWRKFLHLRRHRLGF